MRSFRMRKVSGKTTEKQKEVKIVGKHTFTCQECNYSVTVPYATEKERDAWPKDNGWIFTDDRCICPRCIALGATYQDDESE